VRIVRRVGRVGSVKRVMLRCGSFTMVIISRQSARSTLFSSAVSLFREIRDKSLEIRGMF
jgi:hypothetical protein